MSELDPLEKKVVELIAQKKRISPETVTLDFGRSSSWASTRWTGWTCSSPSRRGFKLTIPDETAQQMKSVRQVVDALRTALAANPQTLAS